MGIEDSIREIIKRIARKEATLQLRDLYNQVRINLMHNPHNTFKGSPSEYIRKYRLAKELKREIYQRFCV